MTELPHLDRTLGPLRDRFIAHHYARHDGLELLLDAMRRHDDPATCAASAEAVLHKIAGAAGSLGLPELGRAASLVETFIRGQLAAQVQDHDAICDALDAFLDVSLQVCNPTGWPPSDDAPTMNPAAHPQPGKRQLA
ncbi:Hpt domain-containing protein [Loktanella sp. DJP18]|uniref:Hpt domain-containing protein n=1 Tax=Loktanella sp. DJP18 TaxID=3409788 RepID=UPI003BB78282